MIAAIGLAVALLMTLAAAPGTQSAAQAESNVVAGLEASNRSDYAEALRLFRLAADQGHPIGQFQLGVLYSNGFGVTRDYVEGYKWMSLSAAQRYPPAIQSRQSVLTRMTADQIAEGDRRVAAWRPAR